MTTPVHQGSPHGVLGVFFLLLGAGIVFDADWQWRGGGMMAVGVACLVAAARRQPGEER